MPVVGIVPAAGKGARFASAAPEAGPKVLTMVHGEPMVRRTVAALLAGGVDRCIVVVAPGGDAAVRAALSGLPVAIAVNADPSLGMFSSIQTGLAEAGLSDTCILLPADMPFVQPATVATVLAEAARTGQTVAASCHGRRGHPIVLSGALRERVLRASPASTLSEERSREGFVTVEVEDPGVHRDVDRPGDLDR